MNLPFYAISNRLLWNNTSAISSILTASTFSISRQNHIYLIHTSKIVITAPRKKLIKIVKFDLLSSLKIYMLAKHPITTDIGTLLMEGTIMSKSSLKQTIELWIFLSPVQTVCVNIFQRTCISTYEN